MIATDDGGANVEVEFDDADAATAARDVPALEELVQKWEATSADLEAKEKDYTKRIAVFETE